MLSFHRKQPFTQKVKLFITKQLQTKTNTQLGDSIKKNVETISNFYIFQALQNHRKL